MAKTVTRRGAAAWHKSITADRIVDAVRREMFGIDNPGFCKRCGHEQEGCEPDARNYKCESCGERAVDGAAEFLVRLT